MEMLFTSSKKVVTIAVMGIAFATQAAMINMNSTADYDNGLGFQNSLVHEFSDQNEEPVGKLGFTCCAVDAGFEEHGPHCVEAATRVGGDYRALEVCKTFHARCMSAGCTQ